MKWNIYNEGTSKDGSEEGGNEAARIDGEVEHGEESGELKEAARRRAKLIPAERTHTGLNPPCAHANQKQPYQGANSGQHRGSGHNDWGTIIMAL